MPHSVPDVASRDNPDSIPNSVKGLSQEWVVETWSGGKGKEVLPPVAESRNLFTINFWEKIS